MNKLVTKPSKYGCPMPCLHTSYNLNVAYMHANTWFNPYDMVSISPTCLFLVNLKKLDPFTIEKLSDNVLAFCFSCLKTWLSNVQTQYGQGYFGVSFYYDSLDVEEKIETLAFGGGSLLAEIGGNIGLLLGFSFLSLLFSILKMFKFLLKKTYIKTLNPKF